MSSYTPFLTENIYQSLKSYIPEDQNAGDTRSVHFLMFPEVKEVYFDVNIERKVKRMQTVIDLTRNVREKHNISLKVPLKELLVFHPDEDYLADIQSLQRYIQSELNVRDVVFSSDEALSGVRYSAVADWGVLGRKLRKDLTRVKNALPKVPSDDIKVYIASGKIRVDGIDLVEGDLTVQRYLELPPSSEGQFATHTDNDVVIRLDIQLYLDLQGERLARELTNRIQKLRKKAGLQATDDVDVYYQFEEGFGTDLVSAIQENTEVIRRIVGSLPANVEEKREGVDIFLEEEQEIDDLKFKLYLARS